MGVSFLRSEPITRVFFMVSTSDNVIFMCGVKRLSTSFINSPCRSLESIAVIPS